MLVTKPGDFGDIAELKVMINGKDCTPHMLYVEIFQDIWMPCWTAKLHIEDTDNIMMNVPIKPASTVSISVKTKTCCALDGQRTFNFKVYGISDKMHAGQHHQLYTLNLVSNSFLKNMNKRVRKAYDQQTASQICSNVISEFLGGSVSTDSTKEKYHLIIPNWSPFNAAWWLTKIALKGEKGDFIFFMDNDDHYKFKSLDGLYTGESTGVTFGQQHAHIKGDDGDYHHDYSLAMNKYQIHHYDGISNLGSGYYKRKLMTYDMINKKLEEKVFAYGDDVGADKAMKPWSDGVLDNAENSHISFYPKHPKLHENETIPDYVTEWQPPRLSNLLKLNQDRITLQVPGGAKSWNYLGKTCQIDLPSQQTFKEKVIYDEHFKGKWLVSALCHIISKGNYTLNVEAIKKRLSKKM